METIYQFFYSCQESNSSLDNLFGIISSLLGALISGLIAIYIFRKGIKTERLIKKEEYIAESNDLEQYFFLNIDSVFFFINKQIEEISLCIKKIKDWNNSDFSLSIFQELNTKNMWGINQERLYKIFISNRIGDLKDKASDFINAKNSLFNIEDFLSNQMELNKKISQKVLFNIELWNQSIKELLSLSNKFVYAYNLDSQKKDDSFLKFYTILIVKKQMQLIEENKNDNMQIYYNEIILPLINYIKDSPNSKDERIILITEPLINIQKAFTEIKTLRYQRRKEILNSGRRLLKVKFILSECILNTKNRAVNYN